MTNQKPIDPSQFLNIGTVRPGVPTLQQVQEELARETLQNNRLQQQLLLAEGRNKRLQKQIEELQGYKKEDPNAPETIYKMPEPEISVAEALGVTPDPFVAHKEKLAAAAVKASAVPPELLKEKKQAVTKEVKEKEETASPGIAYLALFAYGICCHNCGKPQTIYSEILPTAPNALIQVEQARKKQFGHARITCKGCRKLGTPHGAKAFKVTKVVD